MTRTKLTPAQLTFLTAMATDGGNGQRGYLAVRETAKVGTAAALVNKGLMVWDMLDGQVAHQITEAGRAAVAAARA